MTTTDLLDALLAKKGQDYYNEFSAFMAALISDNTSGVAQALAYAQQSQNSSTAAAASAATAASLVLVKQPGEIAGIDPNIDFPFSGTAAVPSGVITGSSSKWVTDKAGLLTSVAAGTAPIDYDPVTAALRGLLVEESRTNLLTYSRDLTQWSDALGNTTVTADNANAPDGTTTADTLSSSATSDRLRRKTVTVSADSVTRVFWAALKAGGGAKVNLGISYSGGTAKSALRTFDLSAGTSAHASGTNEGGGIIQLANGYWLCWLALANNGTNTTLYADIRPYNYPDSSASGSIIFGGAQLEAGAAPTSYIPTTSSTVTRAADVNALVLSSVSGWNASEGTIYVEARAALGSGTQTYAQYDDGTANNRLCVYRDSSNVLRAIVVVSGSTVVNLNLGTVANDTAFKVAFAWKVNSFAASVNGGAAVTSSSGAIPSGLTTHRIGHDSSGNHANGPIRRDLAFPRRASDATLPLLTA